MHPLARQALNYLRELGLPASAATQSPRRNAIPYYLTDAFDLSGLILADQCVLLAVDLSQGRSPADAEKLMRKLREATDTTALFVTNALTSYDRKRLIERRVPFLVPGNQLYVPSLGMDLREYFRKVAAKPQAKALSPSAQAILIKALIGPRRPPARSWDSSHRGGEWTTHAPLAAMAAELGYTPMTSSRAAREIEASGLAKTTMSARNIVLSFEQSPRATWDLALPILRSPVLRAVYAIPRQSVTMEMTASLRWAGLHALDASSMLQGDAWGVYALSRDEWNTWKEHVDVVPRPEPGAIELQVWAYSPAIGPGSGQVDPLSLNLSLRDNEDPRVQSALDEMLARVWQKDD